MQLVSSLKPVSARCYVAILLSNMIAAYAFAGAPCHDRPLLGDANCDRLINNFDVDPFILAISDPATFMQMFPLCDIQYLDINRDGLVNNFDIDPFVELLAGILPPVSDPGGPYAAECQGSTTAIQLEGLCSADPTGVPLSFSWQVDCPGAILDDPNSDTPVLTVPSAGACNQVCTIRLTVMRENAEPVTSTTTATIADTTPPTLSVPPGVTRECGAPTDPSATGVATASDGCNAGPAPAFSDVMSGHIITRTWSAGDACGNTATGVQTITLVDTTPPAIGGVSNLTRECGTATDPSATGFATASDTCGPASAPTFADTVNGNVIARTWTSTDSAGNIATLVQLISIVDTAPPAIICPPNLVLTASSEAGIPVGMVPFAALATDGCSGVTLSDNRPATVYAVGTTSVTFTARDASGNTSTCVAVVQVNAPTDGSTDGGDGSGDGGDSGRPDPDGGDNGNGSGDGGDSGQGARRFQEEYVRVTIRQFSSLCGPVGLVPLLGVSLGLLSIRFFPRR